VTVSPQVEQGRPIEQGRRVDPAPSTKPAGSTRQGLGATLRVDRWSIRPLLIAAGTLGFVAYATLSAVVLIPGVLGVDYEAMGYHSPFFSMGFTQGVLPDWISPAIFVLWIQVLFRATCYYFRGAYYKSLFADPPACAVGEPSIRRRYGMENRLPFMLMNAHRFTLYLAFIPMAVLWYDLVLATWHGGEPRLGLGVILLGADALLVTLYVFSCHSLRHLVGGGIDCFSCTRNRQRRHGLWARVTALNLRHGTWFWASLISIVIADLYIRALALDIVNGSTPVIGGFL
jgi:hypothetical protein